MNLKKNQIKALEQLEKAFLRCSRAGLEFYGIDATLRCVQQGAVSGENSPHSQLVGMGAVESIDVKTYGTYIDSGGA